MKVFLGGTCNKSEWRDTLVNLLKVDYFNPIVEDWTPECQAEERIQRKECDICLYVITPKMEGVFSIAELVDDSNKRPGNTVFVRLRDDEFCRFTNTQWKSLDAVAELVANNGCRVFTDLKGCATYINSLG